MTEQELASVIAGIAPVIREFVTKTIGDLTARLQTLEAREPVPGPPGDKGETGAPGAVGPDGLPGRDGRDGLPGVPGPPGKDGSNGLDGKDGTHGLNGKDGADGLGFDDFEELYDGERTLTHRFRRGDVVKEFVHKMSMELYRGVWVEKTYERGDCVTWAGSEWHCNETTTTKPGDGSKAWTLKVKRGRDGKDGKDAYVQPVVKIGAR